MEIKRRKTQQSQKVGDNVLVRDHTSKAFQPKYKYFCIIGLLEKNQVKTRPHPLNNSEDRQDRETILFKGLKVEDQDTRSIR